jgi:hypothetical protein
LAIKYPSLNPFQFCANNPLIFVDPDGKLILFINGQHSGEGGSSDYWDGVDNTIKSKMGDYKSMYFDGAMGGWKNTTEEAGKGFLGLGILGSAFRVFTSSNVSLKTRMRAGEKMGKEKAAEIFASLKDGESIKIVTHSMGTAYARGMVKALQKYADKNKIKANFEYELDINAFNGSKLVPSTEVKKTDFISNEKDNFANGGIGYLIGSSSSKIPAPANNITAPNSGGHSVSDPSVTDAITNKVPFLGTTDVKYSNPAGTLEPNSNGGFHAPLYEEKPQKK